MSDINSLVVFHIQILSPKAHDAGLQDPSVPNFHLHGNDAHTTLGEGSLTPSDPSSSLCKYINIWGKKCTFLFLYSTTNFMTKNIAKPWNFVLYERE